MNKLLVAHPNLAGAALKQHHHQAYLFTLMGKALSSDGRGWVWESALKVVQGAFGWSDSKYRRVYGDAVRMGWMTPDGNGKVYLASPTRIAESLGIDRVGYRSVRIDCDCLKSERATKQALLRAFLYDKSRTPLSQRYIRECTGLSERTIRAYLNSARDVQRIANYERTTYKPSDVSNIEGAFIQNGVVVRQLPNNYVVQDTGMVEGGSVSAARNANSCLRELYKRPDGETCRALRKTRRWHHTEQSFQYAYGQVLKGKSEARSDYMVLSRTRCAFNGRILFRVWESYVPVV